MFATEDMTLVAVLKTCGIEYTSIEPSNSGVCWLFEGKAVEGQISTTLMQYNRDECLVEPREFTRKLSLVRKDMYSFLGHSPAPVRRH